MLGGDAKLMLEGAVKRFQMTPVRGLVLGTSALFAYYQLSAGPKRNNIRKAFTIEQGSSPLGLLTSTFFETNPVKWAITAPTLLLFGEYHVARYGLMSFLTVFGGTAAGAAVTGKLAGKDYSGALAPTLGLVMYHAAKNPSSFIRMKSTYAMALILFYAMLW